MFATNRMGFLRWPWSVLSSMLLALVANLWALGPANAATAGSCDLDITLNPPLPNVFKISPAYNAQIPFFSSQMTIIVSCLGPISMASHQTLFLIDMAYNTYFFPVAGISGVVPKIVLNPTSNTQSCDALIAGVSGYLFYSTVGNRTQNTATLNSGASCQGRAIFDFTLTTNGNGFNSNLAPTDHVYAQTAGNFSFYLAQGDSVPVNITNSDGSIKHYLMAQQVCTFTSSNINVAMPTISSVALGNIPNSSSLGQTAFTIGLNSCPNFVPSLNFSYLSLANFSFTPPSASENSLLSNTTSVANGGAGNVYVQLLDANKQPIKTGDAVPMTPNGDTTFYAQYVTAATGAVTPGVVTGIANITMSYK